MSSFLETDVVFGAARCGIWGHDRARSRFVMPSA